MGIASLKEPLEELYRTYHSDYLDSDPLALVHSYKRPEDQEVAGFIAAVFAYGHVKQIQKTLGAIFSPMGGSPYDFVCSFDYRRDRSLFQGIIHRFNNETDILCLLYALKAALNQYGSLQALFLEAYSQEHEDIREALTHLVDFFLRLNYEPILRRKELPKSRSLNFFFPSPRNKSACKRLNMFLRWMVRRSDGLDLGIWSKVSPAKLIIPLDTHLFRISSKLGLTARRSADWAAAKEVTLSLSLLDPDDPVKYDFALARLGILGHCSRQQDSGECLSCLLFRECSGTGPA